MGNKKKGSNAERELYQMFVDNCFRAVRVAGSNATAKILSQFWVAIPANDIRKLLNRKLLLCMKVAVLVMFCL